MYQTPPLEPLDIFLTNVFIPDRKQLMLDESLHDSKEVILP
jgi:hypothetical protein